MDYRERIYKEYASVCKGDSQVFDTEAAKRYAAVFSHRFRGWLPLQKGANIIDLACGSGRTLFMLREAGYPNISGIDISTEQIALSRQVTNDVVEGNVLTFLDDVQGRYDLIIAQDIIEHLKKNEVFAMLDACHAALAPGGRLIMSSPNAESPMFGFRRYGDFSHETCFSPPSLGHVLEIVGFEGVAWREMRSYCHGIASGIRVFLWAILRRLIMFYNMVEVGHPGSGVCTRDFLISGVKPNSPRVT